MQNRYPTPKRALARSTTYPRPDQHPTDTLASLRAAIEREYGLAGPTEPRLLRLALNEAEALAWQTGFPQLVFPSLAAEKAQGVSQWYRRQNAIRRRNGALAFAA
jgi:hypothetical protein